MTHQYISPRITRAAFGISLIVTLAGCGGGGSSMEPQDPVIPENGESTAPAPGTPIQQRQELLAEYAPDGQPDYTDLSTLPTGSNATYRGSFYGSLSDKSDDITDTLTGDLVLGVGFKRTTIEITGSVSDLTDADDAPLSGRLTLTEGALNRDGNPANDATMAVELTGTLTDIQNRKIEFGGRLEGDFLGDKHEAIGGEALGRITVEGDSQDFDGSFIAQK